MSDTEKRDEAILESWVANAGAWTDAVREGRIQSRAAGTDSAIVNAVKQHVTGRVLDVGCGEGWLARALAPHGFEVVGIDASVPLVERARELGGGDFRVVSYETLVSHADSVGGPYDTIVLNFALLSDDTRPVLRALRSQLRDDGRLLIQTVHPWVAAGDGAYADGWRVERFDAFGGAFPAPMPWYFRTLQTWVAELTDAGLYLARIDEPRHPDSGRPLSLLITCRGR